MMYRPGFGGWGISLMGISMVLFWLLLLVGLIVVIRYLMIAARRPDPPPPAPSAAEPERALAERFARGDIDEHEYRHRLEVLRGSPPRTEQPGNRHPGASTISPD